jgi:putative Mg2+ transporter-C (MgtC) family protein
MHAINPLSAYWSGPELTANVIVFLTLFGALLLGLTVGYERSYHGRAAGMRTYGLVCMACAALTVVSGFPTYWFGGQAMPQYGGDPTRVIQGIVTGIGFLGAGVIMREGFNISGLTTAASIWATAVIGIVVGLGFYGAAILLAALSTVCMTLVSRLEAWLPSRHAVAIGLQFKKDYVAREDAVRSAALQRGYTVAGGTIAIAYQDGKASWNFVAVAISSHKSAKLADLASELAKFEGVESFQLSHARN